MNIPLIINIVAFVALLIALNRVGNQSWSLSKRVLTGLVLGVIFGLALQAICGENSPVVKESIGWFNIVGNDYVQLLQMIAMPLYLPRSSVPWNSCIMPHRWAKSAYSPSACCCLPPPFPP